jgi:hypothetical protein
VKNTKIFQRGEKYDDFSKWFHYNGQPTQMEDFKGGEKYKDFSKDGFIVIGNRPKWKILKVVRNARISQKMVSL